MHFLRLFLAQFVLASLSRAVTELFTMSTPQDKLSPLMVALSLLGGVLIAVAAWVAMNRATPPEGTVFQRLPAISGVYRCCEDGDRNSRTSKSTIDNVRIECNAIGYFLSGSSRDCGVRQLNLKVVQVEQVLIPTYWGLSPVVSKISYGGHHYRNVDDNRIREHWLQSSTITLVLAGPLGASISALLLLVFNKVLRTLRAFEKS
jgi:hypothetical protein